MNSVWCGFYLPSDLCLCVYDLLGIHVTMLEVDSSWAMKAERLFVYINNWTEETSLTLYDTTLADDMLCSVFY